MTYFLIGFGEIIFGGEPKVMITERALPPEGRAGPGRCSAASSRSRRSTSPPPSSPSIMVALLARLLQKPRMGRALRAVADSHKAALSVGISLEQIWVIVWFAAGIVALATGIMWGARSDVSFALEIVALKALPVLILGGFTSIPGRYRRRPRSSASARSSASSTGGRCSASASRAGSLTCIALVFLLFRPQGLFGERIIETDLDTLMLYREAGQFKDDLRRRPWRCFRSGRIASALARHPQSIAFIVIPLTMSSFAFKSVMIPVLIFSLAAIGLNHAHRLYRPDLARHRRFMGVGAYACYKLTTWFPGANIYRADPGCPASSAAAIGVAVRSAVAAHQGLLSGGCDAGRAVLSASGASCACRGWSTTTSPTPSRCRPAPCSISPSPGRTRHRRCAIWSSSPSWSS